jgi:hypothetical protein
MKKSELINAIKEVLAEGKPGLWANINAKKKRGEKACHGNSNAHKDAVAAGNAMKKEGEGNERAIKGQELVDYIMGHWNWSEEKTLHWLANNFGKSKPAESPKEEDQRYIDYLRRSGRDDYADKLVALNPDKLKEGEGKSLQDLQMGEKFTFNGKEFTFIELYPEVENAARVVKPDGNKAVVSFGGGKVNTGKKAGIGPDAFGQGKGHHID